jgi:hypothetical protein
LFGEAGNFGEIFHSIFAFTPLKSGLQVAAILKRQPRMRGKLAGVIPSDANAEFHRRAVAPEEMVEHGGSLEARAAPWPRKATELTVNPCRCADIRHLGTTRCGARSTEPSSQAMERHDVHERRNDECGESRIHLPPERKLSR